MESTFADRSSLRPIAVRARGDTINRGRREFHALALEEGNEHRTHRQHQPPHCTHTKKQPKKIYQPSRHRYAALLQSPN